MLNSPLRPYLPVLRYMSGSDVIQQKYLFFSISTQSIDINSVEAMFWKAVPVRISVVTSSSIANTIISFVYGFSFIVTLNRAKSVPVLSSRLNGICVVSVLLPELNNDNIFSLSKILKNVSIAFSFLRKYSVFSLHSSSDIPTFISPDNVSPFMHSTQFLFKL